MDGAEKTTERIRGTTAELDEAALGLRRQTTEAEQVLWQELHGQRVAGLKFRRQHPAGPYVLDFYCAALRLAVELDGGVHDQQAERDQLRTEHLERYGIRVLRFRNEEVLADITSVLDRIRRAARSAP